MSHVAHFSPVQAMRYYRFLIQMPGGVKYVLIFNCEIRNAKYKIQKRHSFAFLNYRFQNRNAMRRCLFIDSIKKGSFVMLYNSVIK